MPVVTKEQGRGLCAPQKLFRHAVAFLNAQIAGRFHLHAAALLHLLAHRVVKAKVALYRAGHPAVPLHHANAPVAVLRQALPGQKPGLVAVVARKVGIVHFPVFVRGNFAAYHHIGNVHFAQKGGVLPPRVGGAQNDAVHPLRHGVFQQPALALGLFARVAYHGHEIVCEHNIFHAFAHAGKIDVAELRN